MAAPKDVLSQNEEVQPPIPGEDPLEQFPRQLLFEFTDSHRVSEAPIAELYLREATPNAFPSGLVSHYFKPQGFTVGRRLGLPQDDQSYEDDGFRFRHTFSIASMTVTGWSAVMRNVLSLRRRSLPEVERAEDSPRAMHTEEHLFARFGGMIVRRGGLVAADHVSSAVGMVRSEMDPFLPDTHEATMADWEKALVTGYNLWSRVKVSIGTVSPDATRDVARSAFVYADLDSQEVRFSAESGEHAKAADPL